MKNAIWLFVITFIILIVFLPSYTQMQDLKYKNKEYQAQIEKLTVERQELLEERRKLEEDPEYLEKVGRDQMGLIRKGEVVYRVVEEEPEQ